MTNDQTQTVHSELTGFWSFASKIQLANILTTARMAGSVYVAYLLWFLASGQSLGWSNDAFVEFWAVAWIFIFVALSDMIDGFVARRSKVTALGKFLDPLSDKVLVYSVLVPLSYKLYGSFVWYWYVPVGMMAFLDLISTGKYSYDAILGIVKKDLSKMTQSVDYGKRKLHLQIVVLSVCLATFCPTVPWSGSTWQTLSNMLIVPLAFAQPVAPFIVGIALYCSWMSLAKKFGLLDDDDDLVALPVPRELKTGTTSTTSPVSQTRSTTSLDGSLL